MDMQALSNALSASLRAGRSDYHLTLGDLITVLEGMDPWLLIACDDDGQSVGKLDSYRGYYDDLAFEPATEPMTVRALLAECQKALGKTFTGYKGGDFLMDEKTPLWVSSYGMVSNRAIVGITESGDNAVLTIKQVD